MLQFIRSETDPKNIFINAGSLQDKLDLGALLSLDPNSSKNAETLYNYEFLTNPNSGDELYNKLFGQNGDTSISELVPNSFEACRRNIPILCATYISHYRTLMVIEKGSNYDNAFEYYKRIKHYAPNIYVDLCKNRIDDKKNKIMAYRKLRSKVERRDLENSSIIKTLNAMTLC